MEKNYKYDAFISYRHVSPDKAIADRLQKMLENYQPPKSLRKKKGKWRVFRDETELPTSSNLGNDIKNALENSRFLIVVCSKTTAQSRWCMDEIRYFKELHNGNNSRILTLVADGTPEEVFPPELCNELVPEKDADGNITYVNRLVEPLAANVASSSQKEALKKLKTEFLRIAAPLLGCSYDNLYNREQKKKIKRILALSGAVVLSLLLFSLYNGAMLLKINRQNEELLQTNRSLSIKNSEILANQAQIYYDNDDVFAAMETALEAMPEDESFPANIKAERILAQASGLYRNDSRMFCTTVKLSGYVKTLESSMDGRRIVASDSTGNVYLVDCAEQKIMKSFLFRDIFGTDLISVTALKVFVGEKNAYILFSNRCVAFSLETGDILWEYEGELYSSYYDIVSDDRAGRVFLSGHDYVVLDSSNGKMIFSGVDENENYTFDIMYGYTYMGSDGEVYICNSEKKTICSINEGSSRVLYDRLAEDSCLLSAYEGEKALYFACDVGNETVRVICIDKKNLSLKWECEYPMQIIDNFDCSLFEFSHMIEINDEYVLKNAVIFRSGREIKALDAENGEQYYTYLFEEDILSFEKNTTSYTLRIGTPTKFMTMATLLNAGSSLSDVDTVVPFAGYTFDKERAFTVYGNENTYALASAASSEISLYQTVLYDSYTVLDSNLPNNGVSCVADAKNGVFAASLSNNSIVIFDIFKNRILWNSVSGVGIRPENMIFVGDKLCVYGFDRKGYTYDCGGQRLCSFDLRELVSKKLEEVGNNSYISMYKEVFSDIDGKLLCCIDEGIFSFDVSGEEASVEIIYLNPKGVSFEAGYADEGGISCVVRDNVEKTDKIAFVDEKLEMSCITENGEEIILPWGSVSHTACSKDGNTLAFVSKEGYIGVYDMSSRKLAKIPYDTGRISPLRFAVSPDGEYVFVVGSSGELIRYSSQNSEEAHCQLDITVSDYETFFGFCDDDTLYVSNGPDDIVVLMDIKTLEKRAEIDDVVLIPENTGKAVFRSSGNGWGYYDILKGKELSDFARGFIEKHK